MSFRLINICLAIALFSPSVFAFLDDDEDTQFIGHGESQSFGNQEFLKSPAGKMVNAGNSSSTPIIPKSYREAMLSKDAPIAMIQELHKRSQIYWNQILQSIDSDGKTPLIPDTHRLRQGIVVSQIADLNLSAYRVWNSMVACNGQDPQKARVGFLHAEDGSLCDGNPVQSEIVMKGLKEVAFNWQAFVFGIEATERGFDADLIHIDTYQKIFKNLHPLLTEFTLLIWSAYFNTSYEGSSEFIRVTDMSLFYFGRDSRPDLNAALKFNSAVSLFQGTMLIVYFMNQEDFDHPCATYGLWPAFNRVLLDPERILFFSSHGRSGAKSIKSLGNRICGEIVAIRWDEPANGLYDSSMFGIYATKAYYHKVQMQLLYETYMRSQWDNRNALQKASDSAAPVVEGLGELFFNLPGPNILKGIYRLFNPRYF